MTYYKVKGAYADTQVTKIKRNRLTVDRFLIANELYTPAEYKKLLQGATFRGRGVPKASEIFEAVNVKPKNTYWFFGARFEDITE